MAQTRRDFKKVKKKSRRSYKIFKTLALVAFVLMIIGGGAFAYIVHKMADVTASAHQDLDRGEQSEKREEAVDTSSDNFSILFLGVDDRDTNVKGRTDAILLATFNEQDGTVKMVSIPRDSRVEIAGRDRMDKINHAHVFGGVDMTVATVENLFGVPVDYFVKLNFDAFIEIIDSFGGIEVNVPFAFSEMDSKDRKNAISIKEGQQLLSGEEALAYARMRKKDPTGDIGRGERQQQVLTALIQETASLKSITKFDDVIESVGNNLSTNMSFSDIVSLHSYSAGLKNVESLSIEGKNASIKGVYYYELDEQSVKQMSTTLREHLQLN